MPVHGIPCPQLRLVRVPEPRFAIDVSLYGGGHARLLSRVHSGPASRSAAMRRAGFTSVEIILGLALLVVLFGSAIRMLASGESAVGRSGEYRRATAFAQSVLDHLLAAGFEGLAGQSGTKGAFSS